MKGNLSVAGVPAGWIDLQVNGFAGVDLSMHQAGLGEGMRL